MSQSSPYQPPASLQKDEAIELPETKEKSPYDWTFLAVYFANLAFMLSYSHVFRYSDFVKSYGGSDIDVARILAFAGFGSMVVRLWLGQTIDRFGARWIWLISVAIWIFGLYWTANLTSSDTVATYISRFSMQCGLAGFFGSSITFISLRVSPKRLAEVVGILGTAGFLGMGLGPTICDYLMSGFDQMDIQGRQILVSRMFTASICFGIVTFFFVALAAMKPPSVAGEKSNQSLFSALKDHPPGWILLFGILMGVGLSIPSTFLRPMMESKGVEGIKVFFIFYNVTAITLRILTKRLPNQIGLPKMIAIGMFCMSAILPLLHFVTETWMLIFPAIAGGAAHSFLFPSIVAIFSHHFPLRLRGTATTLALAMNDVGSLMGAFLIGQILQFSARVWILPKHQSDYTLVNWSFAAAFLVGSGIALIKLKNPTANEK